MISTALSLVLWSAMSTVIYDMSTELHPLPSTIKVQFYIGDPAAGLLIFESKPLAAVGTVKIGDPAFFFVFPIPNSIAIGDMNLTVEDIPPTTVSLLTLGTARIQTSGIKVRVNDAVAEILNGQLSIDVDAVFISEPSYFAATSGILQLTNPTGFIASILPTGYFQNLATSPVYPALSSLEDDIPVYYDNGPGGLTTRPEFSISNPSLIVDTPISGGAFTIRYIADLHFAAVPEVSSFHIFSLALASGTIATFINRRKKRTAGTM